MKLTFILELLVILIIVAYGAYGKPVSGKNFLMRCVAYNLNWFIYVEESRAIKTNKLRQAVEAVPVAPTTAKPAADDDDGKSIKQIESIS